MSLRKVQREMFHGLGHHPGELASVEQPIHGAKEKIQTLLVKRGIERELAAPHGDQLRRFDFDALVLHATTRGGDSQINRLPGVLPLIVANTLLFVGRILGLSPKFVTRPDQRPNLNARGL